MLNTAKGYNTAINVGNRAMGAGVADGVLKAYTNVPIDSQYLIGNPFYQFSSDVVSYLYQLFEK